MSCKYKPKFGRVLIEREIRDKTSGGIIIPNAKRHASCVGKIIALGETAGWTETYNIDSSKENDAGSVLNPIQTLNVGDKVIFGRHSGAWLDATYSDKGEANDDGRLFICQDQDILAVIEE